MDHEKELRILRQHFGEGRMEVIVGAGASRASGLPLWNELSRRLVGLFLQKQHDSLDLTERDVARIADIFISHIGREPSIDLVRDRLEEQQYRDLLRAALYTNGPFEPTTVHWELAALVGASKNRRRGIWTLNFDDLLRRAIATLRKDSPEIVTGGERPEGPHVVHLHGYLHPADPSQDSGTLVLSERDFHAATSNGFDWANSQLQTLFYDPNKTVLLVGLSLSDPRLRRLLLDRLSKQHGETAPIYVLLSQEQASADAELTDRLAFTLLRKQYASAFWANWRNLHVIPIPNHDLVPFVLRSIRLGSEGARWTEKGAQFLSNKSEHYSRLYDKGLQSKIRQYLVEALERIRRRFAAPDGEVLHFGAFVPCGDKAATLRMAFHLRPEAGHAADVVDEAYAEVRRLKVADLDTAQGAAGYAFLWGPSVETGRGAASMDRNFTPEMRGSWNSERPVASLLCVPVYDSPEWIPVGVVYLNSNLRRPFWSHLDAAEVVELHGALRASFRDALQYQSALEG